MRVQCCRMLSLEQESDLVLFSLSGGEGVGEEYSQDWIPSGCKSLPHKSLQLQRPDQTSLFSISALFTLMIKYCVAFEINT